MTVFEPFDQATCNAQERPTSEALDGGLASRPNGRTRPRHYMLAQFGAVTAVFSQRESSLRPRRGTSDRTGPGYAPRQDSERVLVRTVGARPRHVEPRAVDSAEAMTPLRPSLAVVNCPLRCLDGNPSSQCSAVPLDHGRPAHDASEPRSIRPACSGNHELRQGPLPREFGGLDGVPWAAALPLRAGAGVARCDTPAAAHAC